MAWFARLRKYYSPHCHSFKMHFPSPHENVESLQATLLQEISSDPSPQSLFPLHTNLTWMQSSVVKHWNSVSLHVWFLISISIGSDSFSCLAQLKLASDKIKPKSWSFILKKTFFYLSTAASMDVFFQLSCKVFIQEVYKQNTFYFQVDRTAGFFLIIVKTRTTLKARGETKVLLLYFTIKASWKSFNVESRPYF